MKRKNIVKGKIKFSAKKSVIKKTLYKENIKPSNWKIELFVKSTHKSLFKIIPLLYYLVNNATYVERTV